MYAREGLDKDTRSARRQIELATSRMFFIITKFKNPGGRLRLASSHAKALASKSRATPRLRPGALNMGISLNSGTRSSGLGPDQASELRLVSKTRSHDLV